MLNKKIDTLQNAIDNATRQIIAMKIDEDSIFSLHELPSLVEIWEDELQALYEQGYYGKSQAKYVVGGIYR